MPRGGARCPGGRSGGRCRGYDHRTGRPPDRWRPRCLAGENGGCSIPLPTARPSRRATSGAAEMLALAQHIMDGPIPPFCPPRPSLRAENHPEGAENSLTPCLNCALSLSAGLPPPAKLPFRGPAKEFGGEIINADSMQVYKNLNVGTAKPTAEERQGIPHHLLDFLTPETPYSVADFTAAAAPAHHPAQRPKTVCRWWWAARG